MSMVDMSLDARKGNGLQKMLMILEREMFCFLFSFLFFFFGLMVYNGTRISEHMGVSPSTGKKLITTSLSRIQAHIDHTHRTISPNYFSIIR